MNQFNISIRFVMSAAIRRCLLMVGMSLLPFSSMRVALLRLIGVRIGQGCYIGFNVFVDTNYPALISIENNVTISHGCSIITHTMSPVLSKLATLYKQARPVSIDSGSWIGMNTLLLPGAKVGTDCFIGAGSVVCGKMPSKHLCAGNPCKPIKSLPLES